MDSLDAILAQWARARPDLDVGPMGLVGRVLRLQRHLMHGMEEALGRHGLNFASFDVLATLRRAGHPGGLSPGALLGEMMVTSGTMTNRLDQLEAQRLVERLPNPRDGRGVIVRLTPAGLALVDAALRDHVARQARLVAALDPDDRQALGGLLRAWLSGFEAGWTG
ncbi:MarR family winged helix-turn-helix transcriptional regulator [Paracraurococcus ruber]|uniref:MarR family transcriptional regulator n=1 Tax=Paracraurococcus ruber TaxID=77675 RepID=A0ABS1D553_9PROT|nr:MarR family transcriptional regulator [Paracraurococcus ruber]MBK1661596.1 MarR family transcriptional regulator [Paracraurococcus ruber]TDG13306.1 MarR family transcriptional regulator [Paracraurococcus ruber]